MKIYKPFVQIAAILGALSVALGAMGAHILKARVSTYALQVFETAVRYQFYHVFAITFVGVVYYHAKERWIKLAGILFVVGVVLFSGSLYVLVSAMSSANMELEKIGFVTPVGGICLIAAWLLLFVSLIGKKSF